MVVPIYDDNPFAAPLKPVVTWCLIALNLAIFLYEAGASQLALDRMILRSWKTLAVWSA